MQFFGGGELLLMSKPVLLSRAEDSELYTNGINTILPKSFTGLSAQLEKIFFVRNGEV